MTFQTTVNIYNAVGVPGDLAFDGPIRSNTVILSSGSQLNTVGRALTFTDGGANPNPAGGSPVSGVATVGGTGAFAGILANPKVYATSGGSGGALSPTLNLPNQTQAEAIIMGEMFAVLGNTANVGDLVYYNTTTGALGSVAPQAQFTASIDVTDTEISPAVAATGTLTMTGNAGNTQTVTIGEETYTFVTALSTGPTVPFEVLIGVNASASLDNLIAAVNGASGAGTTYSTGTTANALADAAAGAGDTMTLTATEAGSDGNAIVTTETLANGSFGAATLQNGANAVTQEVGTMTVSAVASGVIQVGAELRGANILPGVVIQALGTGTGGTGTYIVAGTISDLASQTIFSSGVAPAGTMFVPNCVVSRYNVTPAGLAVIKLTN